jgi:GNAT superfamily N-acetyltransferase
METRVRGATIEDYEVLCEIFAQADELHYEALPLVFRNVEGPSRSRELVEGIIAAEGEELIVAEADGEVVGALWVTLRDAPDYPVVAPRRYAVVQQLVVRDSHRGRGAGRALMEAAHRWAAERRVNQVELNVWEFNRGAIEFYERLGYSTASRKMWITLDREEPPASDDQETKQ